jgi:hypothetical protein
MTAHELAKKLLEQEDKPVTLLEYCGGDDGTYKEVLSIAHVVDGESKAVLAMRTHSLGI